MGTVPAGSKCEVCGNPATTGCTDAIERDPDESPGQTRFEPKIVFLCAEHIRPGKRIYHPKTLKKHEDME